MTTTTKFYRPGEVAKELAITPNYLAKLTKEGKITASKKTPGGQSRYSQADVVAARRFFAGEEVVTGHVDSSVPQEASKRLYEDLAKIAQEFPSELTPIARSKLSELSGYSNEQIEVAKAVAEIRLSTGFLPKRRQWEAKIDQAYKNRELYLQEESLAATTRCLKSIGRLNRGLMLATCALPPILLFLVPIVAWSVGLTDKPLNVAFPFVIVTIMATPFSIYGWDKTGKWLKLLKSLLELDNISKNASSSNYRDRLSFSRLGENDDFMSLVDLARSEEGSREGFDEAMGEKIYEIYQWAEHLCAGYAAAVKEQSRESRMVELANNLLALKELRI